MEKNWTLFEKYRAGKMTPAEAQDFRDKIASDKEFAEEYQLFTDMVGGIELHAQQQLKQKLEREHDRLVPKTAKSIPLYRRTMFVATAAAVAVLLVALFLLPTPGTDDSDLYAAYFVEYPWDGSRSTEVSGQEATIEAYQNYDYRNFLELIKGKDAGPETQMAIGVAHLELNEFKQAHQYFALAKQNPLFAKEAAWYDALTYLKEGNTGQATQLLDALAAGNGSVSARAKKLLNELKE